MSLLEPPEPERLESWAFEQGAAALRLYRWPRPGAPRVLLVHGIGMGHRTFDRLAEALLSHAEVISVDLPGFGDAPRPQAPGSMGDTAESLAAALDAASIGPLIAVGHSMGAQIVAELALSRPELVERAVFIAPAVNAAERTVVRQMLRMLQDLIEGKPLFVMIRGVIEYFKTGLRWFVEKLGPTLEYRIEDRLTGVQQPSLVLVGSRDRLTPPQWCLRLARALPRGELRVLEGSGHEAMIAEGGKVADIMRSWLAGR